MNLRDERFCLEDFIGLEAVDNAPLLCGQSCLEMEITRINVIEDADLAMWSDPGDVILSSGYLFWKDPALLLQAMPKLKGAGVVALGLKPDRADKNIPGAVVALARELDFPLIQLPATAVFANIVYEGRDIILHSKEASLHRVQRQSQQLMDQLLHASTPVECLEVMEQAIGGNPIFAYSNDNELVMTPASNALLYENLQDNFIQQLRSKASSTSLLLTISKNSRAVTAYFYCFEELKGCSLVVLEYYRPLHSGELDMLDRVMPVLVLEINNAMVVKKVRRKYKDRFVKHLIAGKLGGEADICTVAEVQGYHVSAQSRYRVAVVLPPKGKRNAFADGDIGVLSHFSRSLAGMIAFTMLDGYLVLVFEEGETAPGYAVLQNLEQHIRKVLHKGRVRFCISEACGLTEIPEAYQEAVHIHKISARCDIGDAFITYEQLGVLSILSLLPQNKAVQRYKDQLLHPLKEYDGSHNTNLQKTLEVYLSTRCNAKLTAEKMFTHYNTIVYRLERIQKIGAYSLDDAEQVLQLQIALKMDMIQDREPAGPGGKRLM